MMTIRKQLFLTKRRLFSKRELAAYRNLLLNEQLSAEELGALNWQRRREIVSHAFNNNEFYRKKYQAVGFAPGDLKEPCDFDELPILEKQEIRDNTLRMVSQGFDPVSLPASTTGGTTGEPLKTHCDPTAPLNEISWRTLTWWGVDISDNSAYLYRAVPQGFHRLLQQALLWPTHRNWIAALDMNSRSMERFYAQVTRSKPKYLVGYVGAMDAFARFLEQKGHAIAGIKAVWTTSAPLTENTRHYLQHVYQAPVYTQYGSCEFYWVSAECSLQSGLHIASDLRHVDVVDGSTTVPPETFGDLAITDLTNYAFPLIKYRVGDRGRLLTRTCDCGRPFPLMDYVRGRISDNISLTTGEAIPGEFWTTIFDNYTEDIKAFQVRQSRDYSITVHYESFDGAPCDGIVHKVEAMLKQRIGHDTPLQFVSGPVDVNDNGKTRFVVSEITHSGLQRAH